MKRTQKGLLENNFCLKDDRNTLAPTDNRTSWRGRMTIREAFGINTKKISCGIYLLKIICQRVCHGESATVFATIIAGKTRPQTRFEGVMRTNIDYYCRYPRRVGVGFPLVIYMTEVEGGNKRRPFGTTHATDCCYTTHFEVFGTLTMGSGSEDLSGSAEIACRVGRPLTADATGPCAWCPPSSPYTGRSSADMRMDMICWVRGRTTCWNLSISLRKCRTLASRSSSRLSSRTMYSSFFRDSAMHWASSRSRSRNLFITDMLMAKRAAPRPVTK